MKYIMCAISVHGLLYRLKDFAFFIAFLKIKIKYKNIKCCCCFFN